MILQLDLTLNIEIDFYFVYRAPINVPSSCAQFRHEIIYLPPYLLKDRYKNLIRATKFSQGGHFAALEVPELLADDVLASVKAFEEIRNNTRSL